MDNLTDPNMGLADYDPPISTGSFDDSYEQGTCGLPYLALVDGSLHKAQGFEDDVPGDAGR